MLQIPKLIQQRKESKKTTTPRCLSSQLRTQSAPSAASRCTPPRNELPVDTNGTKDASSAVSTTTQYYAIFRGDLYRHYFECGEGGRGKNRPQCCLIRSSHRTQPLNEIFVRARTVIVRVYSTRSRERARISSVFC